MEEERGGIPGLEVIYRNGVTIRPSPCYPDIPASAEFKDGVASKDYVLDPSLNFWVRVFVSESSSKEKKKSSSPVVVYFHGGGFVALNASSFLFHDYCHQISKKLSAIVVSVNYRLAPEIRLPAAYEDGRTALNWISSLCSGEVEDGWFETADFSKVFVAGDSAGGNIVHHLTVRAAQKPERLSFKLAGQILIQPFFGGVSRSEPEVKYAGTGAVITTAGCDFFWKLELPHGTDRNHFPRTLVAVGNLDPLCDRGVEYAKILEHAGKSVKVLRYETEHGFYAIPNSVHAMLLLEEIVAFCEE